MTSLRYYDNTQLTDYKTCPRYYYLRHVRGWRAAGTAMPLVFGLAWHSAMDIVWRGAGAMWAGKVPKEAVIATAMSAFEDTWVEAGCKPINELALQDLELLGARTPMIAQEMLHHYIEKRWDLLGSAKLIASEKPFAVPIYPDDQSVWYIGRRDKIIDLHGDGIVLEHKTTSEYKVDGGFKSSYLEGWSPNSQCEGYLFSSMMEYKNIRQVWVDAALVHKKVHDQFKFIPITATTAGLDNWLWEARDWIERIDSEKERLESQPLDRPVLGAFPRATNSCSGKYGLCTFIHVCRGYNNPAQLSEPPAGFIHEPWHPFKILHIDELGLKDDKPGLSPSTKETDSE